MLVPAVDKVKFRVEELRILLGMDPPIEIADMAKPVAPDNNPP
jgi:hypothetical protein